MNQNDTISTVEATAPETFKIVINTCFGGFGLSDEAEAMWRKAKSIPDSEGVFSYDIERDDVDLVRVVEELGVTKASDRYAVLKVVEVPMWLREKGWHIEEYDGSEHIAENHQTWC